MNIKVQACGFVLLVILYLLYHQQHTLQTYSRRAFLRFYAVTVVMHPDGHPFHCRN